MLADEAPDVERSAIVHKTVIEGLTCYQEIYKEKKCSAKQPTIRAFFQPVAAMVAHEGDKIMSGFLKNLSWIPEFIPSKQCQLCGKEFVNRSNLNIHIRDSHSNQQGPFECEICGKTVKNFSCLRVHMYNKHRKNT
uniref:C2H2-type domain-containing protein n=1 Tax=Timema poppense TaxID=170557 RepID=A0A7R9CRH5_TIMPO|nr:unnamed protein product [Timema poppensis]